jgi:hypothetical protein
MPPLFTLRLSLSLSPALSPALSLSLLSLPLSLSHSLYLSLFNEEQRNVRCLEKRRAEWEKERLSVCLVYTSTSSLKD